MLFDDICDYNKQGVYAEGEVDEGYELELLEELGGITDLVKVVVEDNAVYFYAQTTGGLRRFRATHTGQLLLKALQSGLERFYECFPLCILNPYVELLFQCAARVDNPILFHCVLTAPPHETDAHLMIMNNLVADMRRQANRTEFKATLKRFAKAARKRAASLDCYIDALFAKHSRLVVLRVDLSYEKDFFQGDDLQENLAEVKKDWSRLWRDLNKGVPIPGMLGFACKLEHAHRSGFHFHLLVFYSGSRYRQDIVLARLIGEHWRQVVTEGRGRYFNCNAKKGRYKYPGLGVVGRSDLELIRNLKGHVCRYLAKIDYWLRIPSLRGRSFFRGKMP